MYVAELILLLTRSGLALTSLLPRSMCAPSILLFKVHAKVEDSYFERRAGRSRREFLRSALNSIEQRVTYVLLRLFGVWCGRLAIKLRDVYPLVLRWYPLLTRSVGVCCVIVPPHVTLTGPRRLGVTDGAVYDDTQRRERGCRVKACCVAVKT